MKQIVLDGGQRAALFQIPPPGFDPLEASALDLRRYGFPQLPQHPRLRARYERVLRQMRHKLRFIEPTLRVERGQSHGPRRRSALAALEQGTSWSGVVVQPGSGSFRWLQGDFVVPNVDAPEQGSAQCAVWIGIDGDGQEQDGAQVFQAGIQISVTRTGTSISASFTPFWEWYPAKPVSITNFAVAPGDLITMVLCSQQGAGSAEGTVFFANRRSGLGTAVALAAPDGTVLAGRTAEWIVETLNTSAGEQITLADYGEVFFSECQAVTTANEIVEAGSGNAIVAFGVASGLPISQGAPVAPTVVQCVYTGPQPS
jgi:hypothetical protein